MKKFSMALVCACLITSLLPFAIVHAGTSPGMNGQVLYMDDTATGKVQQYTVWQDGSHLTRLATTTGVDTNSAWSPDGTKIAFTSDRDGDRDIYVMNADGTSVVQITNDPAVDDRPSWSPDGTKIAFQSIRSGTNKIYTMNSDGTNVVLVTAISGLAPAWSPDGQWIAFYASRSGNNDVYKIKPDGTGELRLTTATGNDIMSKDGWSPDSTKLTFASWRDNGVTYEVYTMNADGTNQTRLTFDGAHTIGNAAWAPDGQRILFNSDKDSNGKGELYTVKPDGTGFALLLGNPTINYNSAVFQPLTILPVIGVDSASVVGGKTISINIMANDSSVYGPLAPSSVRVTTLPAKGAVVVNPDGTIAYTAGIDSSGTDTFIYQVCTGMNTAFCNSATVTLTIFAAPLLSNTGQNIALPLIGGFSLIITGVVFLLTYRRLRA